MSNHKDIVEVGRNQTTEEAEANVRKHVQTILDRLVEERADLTRLVVVAEMGEGHLTIAAAVNGPMQAVSMMSYAAGEFMEIAKKHGQPLTLEEDAPHGCANAKPI